MIKIENVDVYGFEAAIRGARNPMNSWDRMDSCYNNGEFEIGENDYDLLRRLTIAGPEHRKWNRMVTATMDITAPMVWWSQYDTYKISTVANSTSKMHKIHAKPFTRDDFSCDEVYRMPQERAPIIDTASVMDNIIETLNQLREAYVETKDKRYWRQMIELLPETYNQKRTVHLNYETLGAMYHQRRHHKIDEWHVFCDTLETLPYSEFITREFDDKDDM